MSTSRVVQKVAILGHVGNKNLGDEAIIASVIQNVRARWTGTSIIAFAINPEDTRERHGIAAFPLRPPTRAVSASDEATIEQTAGVADRWKAAIKAIPVVGPAVRAAYSLVRAVRALAAEIGFSARCINRLRGTDLLIIAGSGQLCDHFGGAWGFPFTLLRWTVLARLVGSKVAFCSTGAGPLTGRLSRRFIRWALQLADYHSYRDETSKRLVEALGVVRDNHVVPDLAYGLRVQPISLESSCPRPLVIGVNPLPFFGNRYWHVSDAEKYVQYVNKLADFTCWLLDHGYAVLPFPTQLRVDPSVIEDMEQRIDHCFGAEYVQRLQVCSIAGVDDLISAIDRVDVVVATRYHGVLISYLRNKPVIGIAYQKKTADLMAGVGQSEFVLDAEKFDVAALVNCLQRILREREAIQASLRQNVMGAKQGVDEQYDRVCGLARQGVSVASRHKVQAAG